MNSSSNSFWSDIKRYEEQLRDNPASYCFAALAEVYLKAGLVDDALSVARAGVARYPEFVAGQMILARVCEQKGLTDEALTALGVVASAVPESLEAQKMLAQTYRAVGRQRDAMQALRVLLEFNPDDHAARLELDALEQANRDGFPDDEDDLELIELGDEDLILDLQEDVTEDLLVEESAPPVSAVIDPWASFGTMEEMAPSPPDAAMAEEESPESEMVQEDSSADDPMVTATVAELYLSQGHPEKALEIYRILVDRAPDDTGSATRLAELERQSQLEVAASSAVMAPPAEVPVVAEADQGVVAVLEGWLDTIRRLRACR